jgi:predicted ATPase
MFLHEIIKLSEKIQSHDQYPFNIPTIKHLDRISLNKNVTFFVGENGSGKSTLLEAIAYQCGFNTSGGSRNNQYELVSSEAKLGNFIRLSWMPKSTMVFSLEQNHFIILLLISMNWQEKIVEYINTMEGNRYTNNRMGNLSCHYLGIVSVNGGYIF